MLCDPVSARAMGDVLQPAPRARRQRSPWMALLSAVLELAEGKGELLRHAERTWASATFTGSRHTVALVFTGEEGVAAAERFIEALADHEFALPRQIVADAAIISVLQEALPGLQITLEAELLLLDDC